MENLNLLGNETEPQLRKQIRLRKYVPAVSIALAVLIAAFAIFGSSGHYTASQIPAYTPTKGGDQAVNEAEKLMFVSHYLNRLVGTFSAEQSEFDNVIATWKTSLESDSATMSAVDREAATEILAIMDSYKEMKDKRANGEDFATQFWPRLAVLANIQDGSNLYSEGNAKRASGRQLDFWTKAESLLNKFRTAQWVNTQGEIVATYSNGDQLTNQHMVAAQIINDKSLLAEAFGSKRILADHMATGIHIEIPTISVKYFHLFQSARLGNKMSSEDQLFSRAVEGLMANWIQSNHALFGWFGKKKAAEAPKATKEGDNADGKTCDELSGFTKDTPWYKKTFNAGYAKCKAK
jgi:hypothetical protein